MTEHPYWSYGYWSYGPEGGNGKPVLDALVEGRRAFALETAFTLIGDQNHSQVIEAARAFEAYLKGEECDPDQREYLKNRHRLLAAMEANGVRGWEHFEASLRQATDDQR